MINYCIVIVAFSTFDVDSFRMIDSQIKDLILHDFTAQRVHSIYTSSIADSLNTSHIVCTAFSKIADIEYLYLFV